MVGGWGGQLDQMILEVFSDVGDSVFVLCSILYYVKHLKNLTYKKAIIRVNLDSFPKTVHQ